MNDSRRTRLRKRRARLVLSALHSGSASGFRILEPAYRIDGIRMEKD